MAPPEVRQRPSEGRPASPEGRLRPLEERISPLEERASRPEGRLVFPEGPPHVAKGRSGTLEGRWPPRGWVAVLSLHARPSDSGYGLLPPVQTHTFDAVTLLSEKQPSFGSRTVTSTLALASDGSSVVQLKVSPKLNVPSPCTCGRPA